MAKFTFELPNELAKQLDTYLSSHPEESITEIIQDSLHIRTVFEENDIADLLGVPSDHPIRGFVSEEAATSAVHQPL